ncbi:protein phosphatase CheZ [Oxalobacteraceae bacterium R-40]|uniref:Protein phosphatase CheZ n=1 Tax=Keguizhuia sedimenti TaxID=3064264 RepID=A0ABU1BJ08_9BURK|nr:protein phosphatase CheZ [Oxalobacteraceae bacterium R-40]
MSEDLSDLDALFDEISSQRLGVNETAAPEEPIPAPAAAATGRAVAAQGTVDANADADADADSQGSADKPMFERLGGIVRLLHDSLRELGYDRSLSEVTSQIGDAQGRLEYVATLTEQAATKVLNTIDESMPQQDALAQKAKDIEDRWNLLYSGKLGIEEFKILAGDSRQFASDAARTAEAEKARLLDIMMAQDFQDITGQLIKKIVHITHSAEKELAQLLRDNAPPELKVAVPAPEPKRSEVDLMAGPDVTGKAMAQDDVDNLLDSLGF